MATTEGFELQEKTGPAEPRELDAAQAGCGARDLKTILNRIADQIADADRRHSAALGTMQDRLVDLVRGTAQARSEQPTDALGPTLRSQVPVVANGPVAAEAMGLALAAASVEAASEATPLDSPPAPLRSALAAGSFMRKDERDAAVDPFDVVGEEDRTGDDEPWDRASAEALTRIYEGEGFAPMHSFEAAEVIDAMPQQAAVEPKVAPDAVSVAAIDNAGEEIDAVTPEAVDSTAPMKSGELAAVASGGAAALVAAAVATVASAPSKVASEPSSTARDDIERAWLETKFADIATMLEQSLEAFRADGAVAVLEQRFEQLEAKLGGAFVDAATRSDVAGIKSIEAQVDELALQFEAVQTQVARLGDIETELRMLGQHVSEERMTKLMAGAASVSPPLDEIAQKVAAEVIAKLPREDDRYNDTGRLDELRSIVKGFITEQRQGDEQTATMLDTMQQAMIRLLDRMDTLESGYEPVPAYPTYAASAEPAGLPPTESPSLRTAIEPESSLRVEADLPEPVVPAIQTLRHQDQDTVASGDVVPEPQQEEQRSKATIVERTERSKEDFVASARRAAKQAAEAKSEEAMAAEGAGKKGSGMLAGSAAAGNRKAGAAGGPSRLLIGVLAVFALGASFSIVNAVMKITNPPVEQRINVAPPDILKGNGNGSTPDAMIDRDGEPDGTGGAGGSDTKREGGMRSGEQSPRMIAPDVESQRKMAGSTGRIVDDTGTPVGIVLQHSAAITRPEHIMRLEEQQQHATWSARLGAQQLPAPVVPAAMVPDISALGDTVMPVTRQAATGESARTVNEMPPAFIGPNSLRSAAAKADPSAEFEVGARFAEGKGLQQDLKQAVAWYQRSASQGFAQAQYRLATMYERGLGVKTDLARAKVWYQRAAEQGTAKAMHNLAVLSTGRESVPADYTAAASWFAKASAYGLVDSQFNLAVLYDGGLGVAKDVVQAYKWYALAARAGDEEAVRRQEALRGKIGAAELAQITAEIDTWRALPIDPVANDPRVAGERWKLSGVVRAN